MKIEEMFKAKYCRQSRQCQVLEHPDKMAHTVQSVYLPAFLSFPVMASTHRKWLTIIIPIHIT